jgi:hypothetical protein
VARGGDIESQTEKQECLSWYGFHAPIPEVKWEGQHGQALAQCSA